MRWARRLHFDSGSRGFINCSVPDTAGLGRARGETAFVVPVFWISMPFIPTPFILLKIIYVFMFEKEKEGFFLF